MPFWKPQVSLHIYSVVPVARLRTGDTLVLIRLITLRIYLCDLHVTRVSAISLFADTAVSNDKRFLGKAGLSLNRLSFFLQFLHYVL